MNTDGGEPLYRVDLLALLTFWKSTGAGEGRLRLLSVPFESVETDRGYYIHDERLTAPSSSMLKAFRPGPSYEPINLIRLANGRFKIFSGWVQFLAAWTADRPDIEAYVIPDADILSCWLEIERERGGRSEEFPAYFVGQVFRAFPSYEEALREGRISCRKARIELGLRSHLPVFRALRKSSHQCLAP